MCSQVLGCLFRLLHTRCNLPVMLVQGRMDRMLSFYVGIVITTREARTVYPAMYTAYDRSRGQKLDCLGEQSG